MLKYIHTLILLVMVAGQLAAQITFNRRFSLDFPASILSNVIVTDSCYYLTGTIADSVPPYRPSALFLKTDLQGEPLVVKTIRPQTGSFQIWNPEFTMLADGTFAAPAYSFDSISKAVLVRFNSNGDTLFTRKYPNLYVPNEFIWPRAFHVAQDGGFFFACDIQGWPWGGYANADIVVIKTDNEGNIEWHKKIGNHWWERPLSLLIENGGNIIIGGVKSNLNLVTSNYTYQDYIIKLDGAGNELWSYLSPPASGLRYGAAGMVLLDDGSLVVASGIGHEIPRASVNLVVFDKLIFKINSDHEVEWEIAFPEPALSGSAELSNIIAVSDGSGFVIGGSHGVMFPSQNALSLRGWIGKISPQGDSIWTRQYVGIDNFNNRHFIHGLKETSDGGFILCGESRNFGTLVPGEVRQQAWLLKLDQHGCLVPGCHITTSAEAPPEPQRLRMAIYPNPTADYLNFYLHAPAAAAAQELSFRIYNYEGRLMREFRHAVPDATYIVEVWDWPAGTYVLQCLSGGRVLGVEQFVKR